MSHSLNSTAYEKWKPHFPLLETSLEELGVARDEAQKWILMKGAQNDPLWDLTGGQIKPARKFYELEVLAVIVGAALSAITAAAFAFKRGFEAAKAYQDLRGAPEELKPLLQERIRYKTRASLLNATLSLGLGMVLTASAIILLIHGGYLYPFPHHWAVLSIVGGIGISLTLGALHGHGQITREGEVGALQKAYREISRELNYTPAGDTSSE